MPPLASDWNEAIAAAEGFCVAGRSEERLVFQSGGLHGSNVVLHAKSQGTTRSILSLQVNGRPVEPAVEVGQGGDASRAVYIPHDLLINGDNQLCIRHKAGTARIHRVKLGRFELEEQQGFFWCWAAVTAALLRHYEVDSVSSQSEIVALAYARDGASDGSEWCSANRPRLLHEVLEPYGCLAEAIPTTVSLNRIRRQIDQDRPVVAAFRSYGTNQGHLVVISGIIGRQKLVVWNSKLPRYSYIDFSDFETNYQRGHTWVNTFFTRKPQ